MSITRKEILIKKYIEFQNKLILAGVEQTLFPIIDDVDISDLVLLLEIKFTNSKDYKQTIKELMNFSSIQISDDELDKIYPIIEEFIIYYFVEFKKL